MHSRGRLCQHGHGHIHESPKVMLVPLMILAVLSVIGGYIGVPAVLGGQNHFDHFLEPVFAAPPMEMVEHAGTGLEWLLMGITTGAALIGLFLAWLLYSRRRDLPDKIAAAFGGFYTAVANKYYVDEIYGASIVRPLILGSTRCCGAASTPVASTALSTTALTART